MEIFHLHKGGENQYFGWMDGWLWQLCKTPYGHSLKGSDTFPNVPQKYCWSLGCTRAQQGNVALVVFLNFLWGNNIFNS